MLIHLLIFGKGKRLLEAGEVDGDPEIFRKKKCFDREMSSTPSYLRLWFVHFVFFCFPVIRLDPLTLKHPVDIILYRKILFC